MKGEAPSITTATLVSQPKPHSVFFYGRAGKLQLENVRLIARMKGEAPSIDHYGDIGWAKCEVKRGASAVGETDGHGNCSHVIRHVQFSSLPTTEL